MDLSDLNLRGLLGQNTSEGPTSADDASPFTTGTVFDVDRELARVRVGVADGVVWLPAIAGRYSGTSLARVLIDPYTSRPVLVAGPVFPRSPVALGTVVSGPTAGTLTLLVEGATVVVPAPTGAYTVGGSAWVMLDDWGTPVLAVGPSGQQTIDPTFPAPPPEQQTITATATIGPQWSGTWRQNRWNNWNNDRYGGPTNIYQGSYGSSGPLVGFAGYGDQVVNLGALSIQSIELTARKNDTNGLSAALTVQGSPAGAQPPGAPPSGGDTATTPTIASGKTERVMLPASMCEAFRKGDVKGLCAVGGQYGGFGGTATAGSFQLTINYTRTA